VSDGWKGELRWLRKVNGREKSNKGVHVKLMGYTYLSRDSIHTECQREELVAFAADETYSEKIATEIFDFSDLDKEDPTPGKYHFLDHNCNHFVEGLLQRIIKKEDFETKYTKARSDYVLNLLGDDTRRVFTFAYDLWRFPDNLRGAFRGIRDGLSDYFFGTRFKIPWPRCEWCGEIRWAKFMSRLNR
jgi:hypothetical protein